MRDVRGADLFCQCYSGGGGAEGLQAVAELLKIQISGENMQLIVLLCDGKDDLLETSSRSFQSAPSTERLDEATAEASRSQVHAPERACY